MESLLFKLPPACAGLEILLVQTQRSAFGSTLGFTLAACFAGSKPTKKGRKLN